MAGFFKALAKAFAAESEPNRSRASHQFSYVEKVAGDLRNVARFFEDPYTEHFFSVNQIQIRRSTKSQDFFANAVLHISRVGFKIEYMRVNSRTGKVQELSKTWAQTIGVTESQFELYLKDHSSIEFIPQNKQTHLYLSVFWQVFHEALNGNTEMLTSPTTSGLGVRLREAASYLIEHQDEVGREAAFSLDKVPTRIDEQDLYFVASRNVIPEIGDKINRWKLKKQLGEGGFGVVFKAENVDTGDVAAIKLMSPWASKGKKWDTESRAFRLAKESFLKEGPLSMKVSSPFVVSAMGFGDDPWPWIMYPLIEGMTVVEAWKTSTNRMTLWWNLAHDLISAMNTIHLEGMVHKDIKPPNILMQEDHFVLLDFGLGEVQGYGDLVFTPSLAGTQGFMAPEIIEASKREVEPQYTPQTDVYAAGVSLLMTLPIRDELRNLFRFGEDPETIRSIAEKELKLPKEVSHSISLVAYMVSRDPEKRLSSKELLKQVVPFIDFDGKLALIESSRQKLFVTKDEAPDEMNEETLQYELNTPLKSWGSVEKEIEKLLVQVRPRYFIINLQEKDKDDFVYVQVMHLRPGWVFEAMSENYSETPQSKRTKANFVRLGWNPPSNSEPNYTIFSDPLPVAEIIRLLVDAFEFGYEIDFRQVSSIDVTAQGPGFYKEPRGE